MMSAPTTAPAHAASPDADRAGPDAPGYKPEWLVRLIVLLLRFALRRRLARILRDPGMQSWIHGRPDLPLGSIQSLAASLRGPYGNSIAGMCLCLGIGPGHPEWPDMARAIVAFGGSPRGFHPGQPALRLHWSRSRYVVPGMLSDTVPTPAADAMALLLSRHAADNASPSPALAIVLAAARPALPPATGRPVFPRATTGPPTGPPLGLGLRVWDYVSGVRAWGHVSRPSCPRLPVRDHVSGATNSITSVARGRSMASPAVLIRAA